MLEVGGSAGLMLWFLIAGRDGGVFLCSALLLTCCLEEGFYILGNLSIIPGDVAVSF